MGGGGTRGGRRRGHEELEDLDQRPAGFAVELLVLRAAQGPAALLREHVEDDAVVKDMFKKPRRRSLGRAQHKHLYRDVRKALIQILDYLMPPPPPPPPPAGAVPPH